MISPWAHAIDQREVEPLRRRFPGVDLIHRRSTYAAAIEGDVAYAGIPEQALEALDYRPWRLMICGDERNMDGLSGKYEDPVQYADRWRSAFGELREAGVTYSTKGLGMIGGQFDDIYHTRLLMLTDAPVRAVNCTPWQWPNARAAIEGYGGRWSVTLIPVRANWHPWRLNTILAHARQEMFRPFRQALREAVHHPNIVNVGIWCLREHFLATKGTWQDWHGLIDRYGKDTWQADVVREVTEEL